jgi:hypothetical protein
MAKPLRARNGRGPPALVHELDDVRGAMTPEQGERQEHHFTLHLASGVILEVDGDPPELPNTVKDIPNLEWRELGSIDPITGASAGRLDAGRAPGGHCRRSGGGDYGVIESAPTETVCELKAVDAKSRGPRPRPPSQSAGCRSVPGRRTRRLTVADTKRGYCLIRCPKPEERCEPGGPDIVAEHSPSRR